MKEFSSQEELFKELIPAINVKISRLKMNQCYGVRYEDIWNYLKEYKWKDSVDLTLGEMVHDIIHVDNSELIKYVNNSKEGNA